MNDFLQSIGYGNWILPALLIIPVIGALAIWAHGAMASKDGERMTIETRQVACVFQESPGGPRPR